jgi:hypothetical protein
MRINRTGRTRQTGWIAAATLVMLPLLSFTVVSTVSTTGAAAASGPPPNSVVAFGSASLGMNTVTNPNAPIVGMAATPDGQGYWVVGADGGIFTFGDAPYLGSTGAQHLNARIIGMAATHDGGGYWLVASDGGIFTFGDAAFFGSTGAQTLNRPIVGMAVTADGLGYWLVASDGGVFAFGDAPYFGSTGAQTLNRPIVGMARTADGGGYWLVASDGGIFTFGDAPYFGSTGSQSLNAPIVGMAATSDGLGYWLAAADGGIFTFGDAQYYGSESGMSPGGPVLTIAPAPDGAGYWLTIGRAASANPFGAAVSDYVAGRADTVTAAVYDIASGQTYLFHPGVTEDEASIMKVDIMATLFSQLGNGAIPSGDQGLLVPMIEQSDNTAASTLFALDGGAAGVSAFDRQILMLATSPNAAWGLTTTTAQNQIDLLGKYVFPGVLSDTDRQYGLSLMENVTPSQAWGVSAGVAPGVTVALKNGWLPLNGNGDWQVNSIGWINGDNRDYLVAVLTTGNSSEGYGISTIQQISSMVFAAGG